MLALASVTPAVPVLDVHVDIEARFTLHLIDQAGDIDLFMPCLCPICTQLRSNAGSEVGETLLPHASNVA